MRDGVGWTASPQQQNPLVQIGDEGQDRFLTEAAEPLLAKLRDAAH